MVGMHGPMLAPDERETISKCVARWRAQVEQGSQVESGLGHKQAGAFFEAQVLELVQKVFEWGVSSGKEEVRRG